MHDCEKQDVILCGGVEKDSDFMTKSDRAFHCCWGRCKKRVEWKRGLPANSRFWWPVFGRGTIPGWWNTRAHHLEHYDVLREQWLHSSPSPWTLISKGVSWFTQGLSETAVPQPDHISAGLLITPSGLIHAPWKVSSAQNDRHAASFSCPPTKVPSLKE